MKILMIVAHPDDEILGAGGTLLKHKENNNHISLLFLSSGEGSRYKNNTKNRILQAKQISKILNANAIFDNFPDNKFDTVPLLNIVKKIEDAIEKIKPDIVYTHCRQDLNIDHRITFQAVLTACRPINKFSPKKLLSFEVLSSTEWREKVFFNPNVYVDISNQINNKIKCLEVYDQEIKDFPHPRSKEGIKILSKYRGMVCGLNYAEAFELIREIND